LDNVLTSETQDPFWHLHPKHFNNYTDVERGLKKAYSRFATGKQEFVLHYRRKYFTRKSYRFKQVPPFWILSEVFTLEQLLSVARSLDKNRFVSSPRKNKLNACATPFGFNSYEALITNIKCILELRNICAHHSRLWNKNLQNPAGIAKLAIKEARANRLYSQLVMVRHMCKTQGVRDDIQPFFVTLFATVPVFRRDMTSMGFPHNWECHPFWI
jgi:abortive infection bacteriophage resistance protein